MYDTLLALVVYHLLVGLVVGIVFLVYDNVYLELPHGDGTKLYEGPMISFVFILYTMPLWPSTLVKFIKTRKKQSRQEE